MACFKLPPIKAVRTCCLCREGAAEYRLLEIWAEMPLMRLRQAGSSSAWLELSCSPVSLDL